MKAKVKMAQRSKPNNVKVAARTWRGEQVACSCRCATEPVHWEKIQP